MTAAVARCAQLSKQSDIKRLRVCEVAKIYASLSKFARGLWEVIGSTRITRASLRTSLPDV